MHQYIPFYSTAMQYLLNQTIGIPSFRGMPLRGIGGMPLRVLVRPVIHLVPQLTGRSPVAQLHGQDISLARGGNTEMDL